VAALLLKLRNLNLVHLIIIIIIIIIIRYSKQNDIPIVISEAVLLQNSHGPVDLQSTLSQDNSVT